MRRASLLLFCLTLAATAAAALSARAATSSANYVDLKLVLAVDISGSMDPYEQEVQRDGYVQAFRDPDVIKTILSGPYGRIAVTYVQWAGAFVQANPVPWTVIASSADAMSFANQMARVPLYTERGTSISSGLLYAASAFNQTPYDSDRETIDISGDGSNNDGVPVVPVRDKLVSQEITINGLPILINPSGVPGGTGFTGLDDYYHDCVTGGVGAFVIPIKALADFAPAIRRKLILEIAANPYFLQLPVAPIVPVVDTLNAPKVNCQLAERSTFGFIP